VFCPIAFAAHPQIGLNIGLPLDNRGCNIYQPDLWIRRESLWVATPVPVGQKVARGMGDGSSTSEVMQFCLQCHTGQRERGRERGIPRGDQHAGNMLSPRGPLAVNCRIFLLRGFFGRYVPWQSWRKSGEHCTMHPHRQGHLFIMRVFVRVPLSGPSGIMANLKILVRRIVLSDFGPAVHPFLRLRLSTYIFRVFAVYSTS
jgi:hypothetical protein